MYYVYILLLSNSEYYKGYSTDLKKRLKDHGNGLVEATKKFRPVRFIFYAAFASRDKALAFGKYLKSSSGIAFRNRHLV